MIFDANNSEFTIFWSKFFHSVPLFYRLFASKLQFWSNNQKLIWQLFRASRTNRLFRFPPFDIRFITNSDQLTERNFELSNSLPLFWQLILIFSFWDSLIFHTRTHYDMEFEPPTHSFGFVYFIFIYQLSSSFVIGLHLNWNRKSIVIYQIEFVYIRRFNFNLFYFRLDIIQQSLVVLTTINKILGSPHLSDSRTVQLVVRPINCPDSLAGVISDICRTSSVHVLEIELSCPDSCLSHAHFLRYLVRACEVYWSELSLSLSHKLFSISLSCQAAPELVHTSGFQIRLISQFHFPPPQSFYAKIFLKFSNPFSVIWFFLNIN